MKKIRYVLPVLCLTSLFFFSCAGQAKAESEQSLKPLLQDISAKLAENAARRPFRFKGMNDSLQWTSEAVKLLTRAETEKTLPMSVWPATSPLTPVSPQAGVRKSKKGLLRLLSKALAAYPKNSFALALQADVLSAAGDFDESNRLWEKYLSRGEEYSSFDREILTRDQFKSMRRYAKNVLRSRGIDFQEVKNQRLLEMPFYEKLWHSATHVERQEAGLNRVFLTCLVLGAVLLILCALTGMEFYRVLIVSLAAFYAAVWLSYACWLYDRAFGLPWNLDRFYVMAFFFGAAALTSLQEAWAAWRYAHPKLADGYRRCPHCREIIVQLSVECEFCHKEV